MTDAERADELLRNVKSLWPILDARKVRLELRGCITAALATVRAEQAECIAERERERDDYIEAMRELAERAAAAMAAAEARLAQARAALERARECLQHMTPAGDGWARNVVAEIDCALAGDTGTGAGTGGGRD